MEPVEPEVKTTLEEAIARGLLPRDVLRSLRGEQRRRAQPLAARDEAKTTAEAKRARRRARNLRAS